MSPHIGLTLTVAHYLDVARTPGQKVILAVRRMVGEGVRLAAGDHGVIEGVTGGWRPDRRRVPPRVNALGAFLLAMQPSVDRDEHPIDAAARLLQVSPAWIEGLCDGFDGDPCGTFFGTAAQREYTEGLECGYRLRAEFTAECACGSWHYADDPVCPKATQNSQ